MESFNFPFFTNFFIVSIFNVSSYLELTSVSYFYRYYESVIFILIKLFLKLFDLKNTDRQILKDNILKDMY